LRATAALAAAAAAASLARPPLAGPATAVRSAGLTAPSASRNQLCLVVQQLGLDSRPGLGRGSSESVDVTVPVLSTFLRPAQGRHALGGLGGPGRSSRARDSRTVPRRLRPPAGPARPSRAKGIPLPARVCARARCAQSSGCPTRRTMGAASESAPPAKLPGASSLDNLKPAPAAPRARLG
jgi:hypothetical protein